ncbi:hypothetical protein BC937DRAFT_89929 [Endogone sp. FLAS-F59071]|nr:hypothetical protein BC937DRAFT_89929 [Endogone sp. FLAS-F59071]|eukprot:RUS22238.1 hypothetical protein BC937DRAFT_89929 [Endogone sp. FLAS-F59071]
MTTGVLTLPALSTLILGEFGETSGQGDAHQAEVVRWALGEPGQNSQYQDCNNNTLILYLYSCEGTPRATFTAIANFVVLGGINPGGVYEVQVGSRRDSCFTYLSTAQCGTANTPNFSVVI